MKNKPLMFSLIFFRDHKVTHFQTFLIQTKEKQAHIFWPRIISMKIRIINTNFLVLLLIRQETKRLANRIKELTNMIMTTSQELILFLNFLPLCLLSGVDNDQQFLFITILHKITINKWNHHLQHFFKQGRICITQNNC